MHQHRSIVLLALAGLAILALGSCSWFQSTGTVTGTVFDSTAYGAPLAGVRVVVVGTSYSDTTDSWGDFSVQAPEGTVTLRFTKSGYSFTDIIVVVVRDETVTLGESVVAYPTLTAGQYRFVLTWGATPYDLDSHLFMPLAAGGTDEVYFGNDVSVDNRAYLDWDDTDSYGPETITIETVTSGTYTYSIYNYSGYPSMGASSNAVVQVYDSTSTSPIRTLRITNAPGAASSSSLWWKVFTFDGATRQFTWVNQMSDTGP